ncbi:hypothetical protein [Roseofilum casamattae]|uniref:Uncharacterized protein n=1 Tax=Roseofilum casamattae BLCC-M143 TaxID=3022442 RepID=A0ABT7BU69_9CYAN|nr:hypothetical protein [Roseofilum casamattae]MDJ1182317.1 hypothetical protein [Roseofilum casamattae BLCC-M143]
MKPSSPTDPVLKRFLDNIPTDIANSFSEEQLNEIGKQLRDRRWTEHPIDVRLSFSILARKFYLVIFAGRDRRQVRRPSRTRKPFFSINLSYFKNLLACATLLVILMPALFGLSYLYTSVQSEEEHIITPVEQGIDRLLSHWGL